MFENWERKQPERIPRQYIGVYWDTQGAGDGRSERACPHPVEACIANQRRASNGRIRFAGTDANRPRIHYANINKGPAGGCPGAYRVTPKGRALCVNALATGRGVDSRVRNTAVKTPSDEDLMLAVGKGDFSAFEQIVLRHQKSAWYTAYRFLGDRTIAEDVAQEAFLKILDAAERYRPTAKFRTYLYGVVTRLCLDHARKKQPAYVDDLSAVSGPSPSPPDAAALRERGEAVWKALDSLPPRQRMAVVLRYYEGLSGQDMAAAMDVSVKGIERLLARARRALEVLLSDFLER